MGLIDRKSMVTGLELQVGIDNEIDLKKMGRFQAE